MCSDVFRHVTDSISPVSAASYYVEEEHRFRYSCLDKA